MTAQVSDKPRGRAAQRLETRQRIYDAAIAEFERSGMAEADIGVIISNARVARGTFYFHFPTKEHVLEEVERNLVKRLASDLARFLKKPHDLWATLPEVIRLVVAAETRLGTKLFRDVLALHFSQTRPPGWGKSTEHPLVALVAGDIERAQAVGEVHQGVDAVYSALFFLLGLYSLLVTNHDPKPARTRTLEAFLASTRRGLEPR